MTIEDYLYDAKQQIKTLRNSLEKSGLLTESDNSIETQTALVFLELEINGELRSMKNE